MNSWGLPAATADRRPNEGNPTFAFEMPTFTGPKEPSGNWELFLGMWDRANFVRSLFWNQRSDDFQVLLTHFLTRMRRYFAVDVCFAALNVSDENLLEVGVPESGLCQLPREFSRRCLESLANSRAPVTWSDAGAGLGFRSTVVAPLRAPTGSSFGFLLLGHARSRTYSTVELFLLQALTGELSWVIRDTAARKASNQRLADATEEMKSSIQRIKAATSAMRHQGAELPKHLDGIDAALQQMLQSMRALPQKPGNAAGTEAVEAEKISTVVSQSLAPCQQRVKERGIQVEVVCSPDTAPPTVLCSDRLRNILSALIDKAALATRNETVRVTVRPGVTDLELMVRGTRSNKVADGLKALFEGAARLEDARDRGEEDWARVREYLDDSGGDVYLKSRPGEAAEFVMRLPLEGLTPAGPAMKDA